MADEKIPGKVAQLTFDEVDKTGAETLVTACGACKRTFINATRLYSRSFRVMDIAELVLESMHSK
jgi:Fe-S oxidoreductase